MKPDTKTTAENSVEEKTARREVAMHLQSIEENPATETDIALFEMFDQRGWSTEQRIAYLTKLAKADSLLPAAE